MDDLGDGERGLELARAFIERVTEDELHAAQAPRDGIAVETEYSGGAGAILPAGIEGGERATELGGGGRGRGQLAELLLAEAARDIAIAQHDGGEGDVLIEGHGG